MNNAWDENSTEDFMFDMSVTNFYWGLSLAIISSLFIGASFILKKKALIRLQRRGKLRAGSGGFGYLREYIWWAGLLSMGIGEAANFTAYIFAPATLVTPLGALSVLVSNILAAICLKEHINLLGKIGCLLCTLGSIVIVLHSPKEEQIQDLDELLVKLKDGVFITYVVTILICSLLIGLYLGPASGKQNVLKNETCYCYMLLCSMVGSLTVMGCKALGISIKQTVDGNNEMFNWLTWMSLLTVILCVMVQMNYLNKALDLFSTGLVTPIYYVFFTTFVIVASAILFREWEYMTNEDIFGSVCGFLIVIIAIFLLNAFKDLDISYGDIGNILQSKKKVINNARYKFDPIDEEALMLFDTDDYGSNNFSRSM